MRKGMGEPGSRHNDIPQNGSFVLYMRRMLKDTADFFIAEPIAAL